MIRIGRPPVTPSWPTSWPVGPGCRPGPVVFPSLREGLDGLKSNNPTRSVGSTLEVPAGSRDLL